MSVREPFSVKALNIQQNLSINQGQSMKTLEKLASGFEINRPEDEPMKFFFAENFRSLNRELCQALSNTQEGISFVQVAEGGLSEMIHLLMRLKELSVQAASGTMGEKGREFSDLEFQSLKQELSRIANSTFFKGSSILNGELESFEFQVGIRNTQNDFFHFPAQWINVSLDALEFEEASILTQDEAQGSLFLIDEALIALTTARARLGALQNRFHSTARLLENLVESAIISHGRLKDADIIDEVSQFKKSDVLKEYGIAALGHAHQNLESLLKLL